MVHNQSVNTFKLTDEGFIVEGEVKDEQNGQ